MTIFLREILRALRVFVVDTFFGAGIGREGRLFFLERKKQRTFNFWVRWRSGARTTRQRR
jgi:hypothetical protein